MVAASPGGGGGGLSRLTANNDVAFAIGVAVVLATLLIPLPVFLMDLLLAVSIGVSLATLVIVLSARESIEFSTFPSLLLFLTLFRLSLNVASTRLILLQGNAGEIINTFGNFVVGGQLAIGLVVFLILVVIQFVVITKGAERISEVAARFNLDAMPGKQMAIDADLNAGMIGEEQARARREKIVRESEFYGAMDGASKFIRGDAVAGLIIVVVNLIGGFIIGMTQGMTTMQAINKYAILSVGDGLVSQIPALIIATSSGFLISKTSTQTSLSQDLVRQMLARSRPLWIAAFLLGAMVLVPGFPKVPFIVLSIGAGVLAWRLGQAERWAAAQAAAPKPQAEAEAPVEELLDVDRLSIQVGARLIKIVDPRRKSSLANRVAPLRKKFAQQHGLVLPLVRLRDNVALDPSAYEIRLYNHAIASGRLEPEKLLAMDNGSVDKPINGQMTREPVFGLPALWIAPDQKAEAELRGYTVVDPESVLMTHLSETLRKHAHELLSRDDVQKLVDRLREKSPAIVNGVIGETVPVGLLHRVLQNLLRDGIPIRDLTHIVESVGDNAGRTKDPASLTELARKSLVRAITEQHADAAGLITAIVLEPALEHELRQSMAPEGGTTDSPLAPERAMDVLRKVSEVWKSAMDKGYDKAVLLCDARLRPHLAGMLARQLPQLPVVAYDEVAAGAKVQSIGTVSLAAAPEALPAR
jgi:flagellar biosynthesis protein FlhA